MASSTLPIARGLPFVGNALSMARDIRGFLTSQYIELGPVFGIRMLHRRFTVLAGVEANRFLMREGANHFRSFEFWSEIVARYGAARSVISSDGADHATLRKTLKRGYSSQHAAERVSDLADIPRGEIAEWPLDTPWSVVPALQRIAGSQVGSLVASHPTPISTIWTTSCTYFRQAVSSHAQPCGPAGSGGPPNG
jgi:cytochrome P450